jgi:hypothetical protein
MSDALKMFPLRNALQMIPLRSGSPRPFSLLKNGSTQMQIFCVSRLIQTS